MRSSFYLGEKIKNLKKLFFTNYFSQIIFWVNFWEILGNVRDFDIRRLKLD